MRFSEKRDLKRKNNLLRSVVFEVQKKQVIIIKPSAKGWPRFNIEDLKFLEKALEPLKVNMLAYCLSNPDSDGIIDSNEENAAIAWVCFGFDAVQVWNKHLEGLKQFIEWLSELKQQKLENVSPLSEIDNSNLNEALHALLKHSEEIRLNWMSKTGCKVEPYSHKTYGASLN